MKRITLVGILVLLTACQKRKSTLDEFKAISGTYIWSYSDGLAKVNTDEKHGVIVDKTGYLYLFDDLTQKDKYHIVKCEQLTDSTYTFETHRKINPDKPDVTGTVTITHSGLREMYLNNFPYVTNYFYENK